MGTVAPRPKPVIRESYPASHPDTIRWMRKRIVIGAIAVVVLGAGAVWYSTCINRRENSVEYHKREYLAARDGRPLMNELRSFWGELTGQKVRHRMSLFKLQRHEQALLRLGYWREETVIVNMPAAKVWGTAVKNGVNLWRHPLTKEICVVAPVGTNTILVRAVPDHIPIWKRLIREADVPRIGE
jgi:hypothetical protein